MLFSHSVMSDSVTPWTAACPASLSLTISRSFLQIMSIESVMPSNHLILCRALLLLPLIFPSIRVFSNESALHIMWPKYWRFRFSISLSNVYSGLIDRFGLLAAVCQGHMLSSCLLNLYTEYIMRNVRLDELQAGIKIAESNINNLRYADTTTIDVWLSR